MSKDLECPDELWRERVCNRYGTRIETLTDEVAPQRCRLDWPAMTIAELLFYNLRRVQERAAQLSLLLGQRVGFSTWLSLQ